MSKPTTVTLRQFTRDHTALEATQTDVPAVEVESGLVLVRRLDAPRGERWLIVHASSGLSLEQGFPDPTTARRFARSVAALADWSQTLEALRSDTATWRGLGNRIAEARSQVAQEAQP